MPRKTKAQLKAHTRAKSANVASLGDLVLVEWDDASVTSSWMHRKAAKSHAISKIATTGFLVEMDDEKVILASSVDATTGNMGSVETIPRGCVTSIKPYAKKMLSPDFWDV